MKYFLIGLAIALLSLPAWADYYTVAMNDTRDVYVIKRFVGFADCREDFHRLRSVIELTGGTGHVICVPASELEGMGL